MLTKEEEQSLVNSLRQMHTKYPKWMDKANYNQSQKFKDMMDDAKILFLKKNHDHRWVVDAKSLVREYKNLYWDVNS